MGFIGQTFELKLGNLWGNMYTLVIIGLDLEIILNLLPC